jgi:chorismate synthase
MNTFGKKIKITLFGASHEEYIGLTITGFPAGIEPDYELIAKRLAQRRGLMNLTSKRLEKDDYLFISGIFQGKTTGAPLTVLIKNQDLKSEDYQKYYGIARPSHADFTQYLKYQGYEDYRGGGISSGRLTVAFIILGALAETILKKKGILVASRLKSVYTVIDEDDNPSLADLIRLKEEDFPVLNFESKAKMLAIIEETKAACDSLGGVVETWVAGLGAGFGEPFFESVESQLSHLLFSVPGVKGIEFGSGFQITKMKGSHANDEMYYEDGEVRYYSNHSGGINGGITNGNLICFRTAFKPTPSIALPQRTINFLEKENTEITISGRHDTIYAIKALHVVNALSNYAILDLIES